MRHMFGILLALGLTSAGAAESVATGIGRTVAEALTNAKVLAVEQVVGTFVIGRQWTDGDIYQSRTDEFNGGMITRYEVIDTVEKGSLVEVRIRADVDTDKVNSRLVAGNAEISKSLIDSLEKSRDDHEKTKRIVAALDDRTQAFAVTVEKVDYLNRGEFTDVTVALRVGWQPKWVDDVRVMSKSVGRDVKTDTSKSSLFWILATLSAIVNPVLPVAIFTFAQGTEDEVVYSSEYVACFSQNAWTDIDNCREIRHPLASTTGNSRVTVTPRLVMDDRSAVLAGIVVDTDSYLFRHFLPGGQLSFSGGGCHKFGNPGVLLFSEGSVERLHSFTVRTEDLKRANRIEFDAV